MKIISQSYSRIAKTICFLLALHIFNLSIDPKDREADFAPEDLSFNDIESIAEFVTEVVFGIDNAFAEQDEPDGSGETYDFFKDFCVGENSFITLNSHYLTISRRYFIHNTNLSVYLAKEITSPPPKC